MKFTRTFLALAIFAAMTITAVAAEPKVVAENRGKLLAADKKEIKEITVQDLYNWTKQGKDFTLLDIREGNEVFAFKIPAKKFEAVPRGLMEWLVGKNITNVSQTVVVYCKSGGRGTFATKTLQDLGYKDVYNLKGGIIAWLEAGYPVKTYLGLMKADNFKFKK